MESCSRFRYYVILFLRQNNHAQCLRLTRRPLHYFMNDQALPLSKQYTKSLSVNLYVHGLNLFQNVKQFSTTMYVLAKGKDRGKDKKKGSKVQHIDMNEMSEVVNVEKLTENMEKALNRLKDNFIKNLSLRSTTGAIEELKVHYEGKDYLLQELAQVNRTPKFVALNISAFPQIIPSIIESIRKNQMNLNPQQDGTMIYIQIPKVTKEHREGLSKNAKAFFIKCKNEMQEIRNKEIKRLKNQENLPTDLVYRVEGYIDLFYNQYVDKAEKMLETKQKELLGDS